VRPTSATPSAITGKVTDSGVLGLIRGWLRAPVIECDEKTGKPQPPRKSDGKGTPQGGVISPLLANVYLHWFDVMFHLEVEACLFFGHQGGGAFGARRISWRFHAGVGHVNLTDGDKW